jgi:thiol:disulfide interchange protein
LLNNLIRLCAVGAVALSLTLGVSSALPAQGKAAGAKAHGPIAWQNDLAKAQKIAAKEKKLIMVDFYADWCGPCVEMLKTTYKDKAVVARSKEFVPLLIDVDKHPELARKYDVTGIPRVIFMDAKGKVVTDFMGYQNAKQFLDLMTKAKKGKS